MAENVRPPVAIRIVRPYQTEDELLEHELETIGKASVILIGAHPRPTGVILRFELSLGSGVTALRGEGRVLGHKESAFRGQPGLSLRFTRLDPKSKALVDRATAMREARAQGDIGAVPVADARPAAAPAPQPAPSRPPPATRTSRPPAGRASRPPSRPDPALARALTGETPPPAQTRGASARPRASAPPPPVASAPPPPAPSAPPPPAPSSRPLELTPPPPPAGVASRPPPAATEPPEPLRTEGPPEVATATEMPPKTTEAPPTPAVPSAAARRFAATEAPTRPVGGRTLPRPPDRDGLLVRLRERRAALSDERVRDILSKR